MRCTPSRTAAAVGAAGTCGANESGYRSEIHASTASPSRCECCSSTALLSVSNHVATIDDPHLLASIVPLRTLLHGASEMRWGVCADDVCFRPGTALCRLADAAKVLPIRRGAGIWQPELDAIIEKLRGGEWVHYEPWSPTWMLRHGKKGPPPKQLQRPVYV